MDCNSANILMMKYMDQVLTEKEALSLNVHITDCKTCKEDFFVYECIIQEFEKQSTQLFEPPAGFEELVMERVSGIVPDYGKPYSQDAVVGVVFGAFSMLFGIGVIFSLNRAEIMAFGENYPYVGALMEKTAGVTDSISLFAEGLSHRLTFYLSNATALIEAAKYGILAIIVGLMVVQFVVYSKNKVEI